MYKCSKSTIIDGTKQHAKELSAVSNRLHLEGTSTMCLYSVVGSCMPRPSVHFYQLNSV